MMNEYQRKVLYAERFYSGTPVSNIGGALVLTEDISAKDCEHILHEMVEKVTALRLRLDKDHALYVCNEPEYPIITKDINGDCEAALAYAEEIMRTPFANLYNQYLFEFHILLYHTGRIVFLKLHHLLGDAASVSVLCKLFEAGYVALKRGEPYHCSDVSAVYPVISSEKMQNAKRYFAERLNGYEPVRLSDKESTSCKAGCEVFSLPVLQKDMVTSFVCALYAYLSAITNAKKIAIGFVLGNRRKKEMDAFGMYANTLPLVIDFDGDSLKELRRLISNEILHLMRYSSVTLEQLSETDSADIRAYDVSLSYRKKEYIPGTKVGYLVERQNGCLDTPIRIVAKEWEDTLTFEIYYQTELFDAAFISNMGNAICSVLGQLTSDGTLSELDILTTLDKAAYRALNAPAEPSAYHDIMELYHKHLSDSTRLVWGDNRLNGLEFDRRCRGIAAFIQQKGYQRVGLKMKRSHELIEAAVGALMAGAAFLVISEKLPHADAFCDVCLTEAEIPDMYAQANAYKEAAYAPDSTAYMVCTSGSTGVPKCIEISRASLLVRLEWANRTYGLSGVILQKTVNTFDVAIWEMLSVLYGAQLVLPDDGDERLPDKIADALRRYHVEKVHFVPSMLRQFLRYAGVNRLEFPDLKEVYVSGEKLEASLVKMFFDTVKGSRLLNFYGPAECTIDVAHYECIRQETRRDIPIGHPVDNTQIYIINDENRLLPVGVPGELCVTGALVGKGYLGREAEAASGYFLLNGQRAYKTGDIGKLDFDGNLYINGRKDRQVKVRGIRVNLSDIKQVILNVDGVADAEVIEDKNRLECFYVGEADAGLLQKAVAQQISAYAVPSVFYNLERLPLTINGKIDLEALKEQSKAARASGQAAAEQTHSELEMLLLTEVRQYVQADVDENLFDAGLDSINMIDIVCRLQEEGYALDFSDFYENITIRNIAANYNEKRKQFTFLKKGASDTVMVYFPYAGGEPQSFRQLAGLLPCDAIGVSMSAFDRQTSVEEITETLCKQMDISQYKNVYVYGHCVGAMPALAYADRLGERLQGIFLAAPAVRRRKKSSKLKKSRVTLTPWMFVPDRLIAFILKITGGNAVYPKAVIDKFRTDTTRFFAYAPETCRMSGQCRMDVIFGGQDIFTRGQKKLVRMLQELGYQNINIHVIKNGKHFLNKSNYKELSDIMRMEGDSNDERKED